MKIKFYTAEQARKYFLQPDEYAQKLPLSNLQMICPENPTLEGYQEVFLNSFEDFTNEEKSEITSFAENLIWLDLEVKMIKTDGSHSLDITQTRKDAILASRGIIGEHTFVHEVYHVMSRKNPSITPELAKLFGFKQVPIQHIEHDRFLLNPDAIDCNYSIVVQSQDKKIEVTPFVTSGLGAGLKVTGKKEYIHSRETNYYDLIPNTTYLAHPEEICAEYFTLVHLGACIFYKTPQNDDRDMIELYRMGLEELCKKQDLIQGIFPQVIAEDISLQKRVFEEEENPNEVEWNDQDLPPVIQDYEEEE